MKINWLESETLQIEIADQQNIDADHHSFASSKYYKFSKYLNKVEKDQLKKRHLDVNKHLNMKLKNFKQHFIQTVEDIEEKYNCSCKLPLEEFIPLLSLKSFEMQFVQLQLFFWPRSVWKDFSLL